MLLVVLSQNTRSAFGKTLIEQPLMQNVLVDLCVESEAHTLMALRMSAAFDAYYNGNPRIVDCDSVEEAQELFRLGVSVSKYFVTKRLPQFTFECMEAMGGNGFVEDLPMARLFRHSPLNSIWEGSGNVIALDVLRGAKAIPTLLKEIKRAKGMDSHLDQYVKHLEKSLFAMAGDPLNVNNQRAARNIMDRLAVSLQASILLRFGDPRVSLCGLSLTLLLLCVHCLLSTVA
jgi:putative acyl-CoA dehydrogenase